MSSEGSFVGQDVERVGLRADEADGARGVREGGVAAAGAAVLEEECRDAAAVEPRDDVEPLVVPGEDAVAAAGADDDGGAGVAADGRGGVEGERGPGDVGDAGDGVRVVEEVLRVRRVLGDGKWRRPVPDRALNKRFGLQFVHGFLL